MFVCLLFFRKCLCQIKSRHFCRSAQWVSFSRETCSQCLRIAVEGLSVEGQMKHDRYERVNFESERWKIFKLYRGTPILERREILEERVMQSLGLFF